ncbi:FKBP-type peptidyl-prolyl cis-trans isomerase [Ilyonectria destructans]|nr:FKBP-type peptidyl-prolyl cis-trans isomerase [Ilyonectria destructans]
MGVVKTTTKEGTGAYPKVGQTVAMQYTGYLKDPATGAKGKKFDSSLDRPGNFVTAIGVGQVIKGWDEGVPQMQVGEHATLDMTADYGYGARGAGGVIPPNADLIFDVVLVSIE